VYSERIRRQVLEVTMGKLLDFYKQHRRLFLAQKHQNTFKTQKFRDKAAIKFFLFCESQNLLHTDGIRKKQVVKDFFGTKEMSNKSDETRRKYFLVIREIYRRFFKINIGIEVLK
jgi:hypothetical protein